MLHPPSIFPTGDIHRPRCHGSYLITLLPTHTSEQHCKGQNLIMNDKVIAYNRTTAKVDHFLLNEAKG